MHPVDAIVMALSPGSPFNQNGKVFRSAKSLAQFASIPQNEVLGLVAENLADRVTIRPSAKHPENGPLIALTEFIPAQQEHPEAPQIQILAGNAVAQGQNEELLAIKELGVVLAGDEDEDGLDPEGEAF